MDDDFKTALKALCPEIEQNARLLAEYCYNQEVPLMYKLLYYMVRDESYDLLTAERLFIATCGELVAALTAFEAVMSMLPKDQIPDVVKSRTLN